MILIDTPSRHVFRGRIISSSHMCSDLPGPEGTAELLAFARRIGSKAEWLQNEGAWNEHFDVMNARYRTAIAAGARAVRPRDIVAAMRAKEPKQDVAADGGAAVSCADNTPDVP